MLGYLKAHWRGELSLVKSVFLNGLLAYLVLVAALVFTVEFLKPQLFFYVGMAVFFAWGTWALVGISRVAIKNVKSSGTSTLQKIVAILALFGVVAVVTLTLRDIWMLSGPG